MMLADSSSPALRRRPCWTHTRPGLPSAAAGQLPGGPLACEPPPEPRGHGAACPPSSCTSRCQPWTVLRSVASCKCSARLGNKCTMADWLCVGDGDPVTSCEALIGNAAGQALHLLVQGSFKACSGGHSGGCPQGQADLALAAASASWVSGTCSCTRPARLPRPWPAGIRQRNSSAATAPAHCMSGWLAWLWRDACSQWPHMDCEAHRAFPVSTWRIWCSRTAAPHRSEAASCAGHQHPPCAPQGGVPASRAAVVW